MFAFKKSKLFVYGLFVCGMLILSFLFSNNKFDEQTEKMRVLEKKVETGDAVFINYLDLGKIYFEKERYEDTIKCMEDLFKDYASSHEQVQNGLREYIAEARSYRGKALYLLGKKEEAIADLTKGTQEAYDYYQIGLIYFKKEKYTEVVECMNKAIKKSVYEQINDAYTIRGKAKFYLGEKEGATIDLVEAGSRGMSDAVEFLKQNGLEWGGEAKEKYDRMVSDFSRISSQQNTRTGKYYPGRDEVFTKLRDNIENSDMPYKEKVKAELKLHDDMYKE